MLAGTERQATKEPAATAFRPSVVWTLHGLMFASGAFALIYEILWMRQFASVFGATTPAVAATLAAIFLGFTCGNLAIGNWASRARRPLGVYALLEVGIGAGALIVQPIIGLYDSAYPWLYENLSGSPGGFLMVKTLLATVALFIPAFCMGGTVPLLGHALAADRRRLGVEGGGLYAANIAGAALGALSVPFFWLPIFGANTSYLVCVGGNFTIAAAASFLDAGPRLPSGAMEKPKSSLRSSLPLSTLLCLAAASGFFLFVLQVFWERMFAQVHENSIYSFAIVLAVLLLGLGLGAMLAHAALVRNFDTRRILAYSWIATSLIVVLTPEIFFRLTDGLSYLKSEAGSTSYGIHMIVLTLPTVFVPSTLGGMALPLIMELAGAASRRPAGHVLGCIIGANTAGAILGALLAAFVLPQWLGLWKTFAFVPLLILPLAMFPGRRMLVVVALLFIAGMDFFTADSHLPRTKLQSGESLLALRESSHGIVAVVENSRGRRLKLNNHYVLGGTASTGDERMQAHIPLLLHPSPKRVAFLGLGTGITAGASQLHPTEQITAIEIVPEAIGFARQYFAEANLRVIDSPSVEIVAADARNFLKASRQEFDVIVGDLFVPWRRGEASLYTIEHFRAARQALARGGLFCQWLPLFQLSEDEFKIVAATFLAVFPNTTMWRGDFSPNEPAIALIAHPSDSPLDPATIARRVGELKADSANPFLVHPAALWIYFAGSLDHTNADFSKAARHTENEPWLELLAPRSRARNFVGRPLNAFLTSLPGPLPPELSGWRDAGNQLAEATVLLSEGKQNEAQALLNRIAAELPAEARPLVGASP